MAIGVSRYRIPGGWTKTKSTYGAWPFAKSEAAEKYTPSSKSIGAARTPPGRTSGARRRSQPAIAIAMMIHLPSLAERRMLVVCLDCRSAAARSTY